MGEWEIENIRTDGPGLRVDFIRRSPFEGVDDQRVSGIFNRWITRYPGGHEERSLK